MRLLRVTLTIRRAIWLLHSTHPVIMGIKLYQVLLKTFQQFIFKSWCKHKMVTFNIWFLSDLDLGGSEHIVALCITSPSSHLCPVILTLTFQQFKSYEKDTKWTDRFPSQLCARKQKVKILALLQEYGIFQILFAVKYLSWKALNSYHQIALTCIWKQGKVFCTLVFFMFAMQRIKI